MNKFKLIEQRILSSVQKIRNGKDSLYNVAKDCIELFNSAVDYAAAVGIETDEVADHINTMFLGDFNIELSELIVVMQVFPSRNDWNQPLSRLYDEAASQVRAARSAEPKVITRRRASLKDLEDLQGRLKESEAKVRALTRQVDKLKRENAELKQQLTDPISV